MYLLVIFCPVAFVDYQERTIFHQPTYTLQKGFKNNVILCSYNLNLANQASDWTGNLTYDWSVKATNGSPGLSLVSKSQRFTDLASDWSAKSESKTSTPDWQWKLSLPPTSTCFCKSRFPSM
jgi:hypothetical protein